MSIEIKGLPINPAQTGQASGQSPAEAAGQKSASDAQSGAAARDQISLTDTAKRLQSLTQEVSKLPEVDSKRVEAIRESITNGTYQVDAGRVADKMMSLERALADMG